LFEKSLEYNPRYVEAIMNLGKLYLLNSMPLKAEEKFLEAKKVKKDLPQIYFYLGDVYTSQQMYSKAEDCYLQGLRYDPENVYAMLVLGKIYINQQKYDLAERTFLSALKMKITDETIKTALLENLRQARQHIK
jgi:tetratricopeptide (TPR) repeat protein